ncbi:MAG: replication-associated recombination protein A [Clostridiales bacterium]|nr:replication-associated recombination protein A [Clostridiales bacterium]
MQNQIPLAERMRPQVLSEFVGQKHIVGKNMLLWRAIEMGQVGSCIFYGPPGTGKTTLANIIAKNLNGNFRKLNAVSSGVGEAKEIIAEARKNKLQYGTQTYLLLDECHRWNKAQSDSVLAAIEDGSIIFIGSTTENPFYNMTRAIVSRCRVFEFKFIEDKDIIECLQRAIDDEVRGFGKLNLKVADEALKHFAWASAGDVRMALNALDLAVNTTPKNADGQIEVDLTVAEQSIQKKALSVDENMYYELLSSFCKSIRGSDSDAAIYYSQRLILAGCDPLIIARRLIAHASEDIGMADSNALLLATSAMYAVEKMGIPEGLIPLTHAIIYACEAEKSNSVIVAMNAARADAENVRDDNVLNHLKNHPSINGPQTKYKYPHDYGGYVKQQYMPNALKDKIYYVPGQNGKEKNLVRKKFKENK